MPAKPKAKHIHVRAHNHVEFYEVCECGASRKIRPNGAPEVGTTDDSEGWHTCKLCTPAFFLTEPPATDWNKLRTKGAR